VKANAIARQRADKVTVSPKKWLVVVSGEAGEERNVTVQIGGAPER
jgi:hypothetical protein